MSPPIAINVENISKQYALGSVNRGSFQEEAVHAIRKFFRRPASPVPDAGQSVFKALDDVSFEVARGEVAGLVGGNGAGKSTMLKILARITEPTSGRAVVRGRTGSLLEVGAGFHSEFTGRQNVFMSGTILGMRQREIATKFDEIVAFSGVEKFIDTPVKHYSSGMYVRLAFAVSSHLDAEVLFIDEVLAVGDLDFQTKCLRKMDEMVRDGRTIVFVSHNMESVRRICNKCYWFDNGRIRMSGATEEVVAEYEKSAAAEWEEEWEEDGKADGKAEEKSDVKVTGVRVAADIGGGAEKPKQRPDVLNSDTFRYRGDSEGVWLLYHKYKVGALLLSKTENDMRHILPVGELVAKKGGVLLTAANSPRITRIIGEVREHTGFNRDAAFFTLPDEKANAFAGLYVNRFGNTYYIGLYASLAELLDDGELAFVLGHELGHIVFHHNDLARLCVDDPENKRKTVLQHLSESFYMKWRQKSEISADRIGYFACGCFETCARALIKIAGKNEGKKGGRNLPGVDELLADVGSMKGREETMRGAYCTHPNLIFRLKALKLLDDHIHETGGVYDLEKVDARVDEMLSWANKYPVGRVPEAVMRVVACAGLELLVADEKFCDREAGSLVYVLHKNFTDDPEAELLTDAAEREARLDAAVGIVNAEGSAEDRNFIVTTLARLAFADGMFLTEEQKVLLEVAEKLKFERAETHSIIAKTAREMGFDADAEVAVIAGKIREKLGL